MISNNSRNWLVCLMITFGVLKASASSADQEIFPSVSAIPNRECNLGLVTIIAGQNGNPNSTFPTPVTCPVGGCSGFNPNLVGNYLQWDYTVQVQNVAAGSIPGAGSNISYINSFSQNGGFYITVSNDTSVSSTSPVASSTNANCPVQSTGFNCPSHILGFLPQNTGPGVPITSKATSQYTFSFLTPQGYSARIAEAGVLMQGNMYSCLIAGAGVVVNQNQPVLINQTILTPGCSVSYPLDINGHVSENPADFVVSDPANCQVSTSSATYICDSNGGPNATGTNCKKLVTDLPKEGAATEGSCNYSFTNTLGGRTTISCTTCCVQASTNKCVLKSSLASPSTQCTTGSYP